MACTVHVVRDQKTEPVLIVCLLAICETDTTEKEKLKMQWAKTSAKSWEKGNKRIVKQYKPCQGGEVYAALIKNKLRYFKTLEKAQEASDKDG